ncbi:UNVERIFIED_CONTAM: Signal recognition particle subunit SRP72 [Sesamum radiatum]|uniref:Signal recognition particle subunit SRP72 n=1 Tax=Sesamum radiatum TaxID=300843 RepID=A0AAW2W6K0_SESRA
MPPKAKEKSKPAAAAAPAPAVAIEDLFTSLNRHIQRSEFDLAVKVSDQVLAIAPGDEDAIGCKIVALIKNDNIEEALSAIQGFSKKSSVDFSFFNAYCFYRQNRLDEALETLKGQEENFANMLLQSQISFRLGKMDACVDIYQKLQKSKIDSLEINFVAGLVSAGRASEVQGILDSLRVKPTSSFELAYNVACSLIERNMYKDAEQLLLSSRRIGQETLVEENLADDDIEIELAPIAVQLAYIQQARELASALPGMFPNSVMPVLLQAAVHVRENKANKAEELLWQFANKYPDKSKVILLARAQVAAAAGHPQIAAESLLKIPDIQHKPATVATLVSLKERAGDIDGAGAVLDSAIQWWSNAMTEDNKLDVIMQEAASFKLRHGKKDEAARLYEELVKSHGSMEALVGLIQTAAHTDIEKAESYEKQLKPIPGLKGIDVESLEKTSGAKHTEKGPTAGIPEAYEPKNKEKTKKKRKRKPKYPKGFDPANPGPPPDPERWLPKRERSSYRPKRKDKRAAQIRGSQGAVVKEADSNANAKSAQAASSKGNSQNTSMVHSKPSSKSRKKSRN